MLYNNFMYPYLFNLEYLPMYIIWICLGVLAALILYRVLSSKVGVPESSFRFYGVILIVSIGLGFVFSRLFQMLYNYAKTGDVGTGITFLGGLIGGVATFFVLVAILGKKYRSDLFNVINIAMPCIALGHCLGRIGCFFAGCCFGAETDTFMGIQFVDKVIIHDHHVEVSQLLNPRIPTQLIEAFFLLLLCISLLIFIFRFDKLKFASMIYLYAYGVFRFLIEFVRDDERGAFLLGLSPSQLICLFMLAGAIVLNVLLVRKKAKPLPDSTQPDNELVAQAAIAEQQKEQPEENDFNDN